MRWWARENYVIHAAESKALATHTTAQRRKNEQDELELGTILGEAYVFN